MSITNHEIPVHAGDQVDIILPNGSKVNVFFDGTCQISIDNDIDNGLDIDVWYNGDHLKGL